MRGTVTDDHGAPRSSQIVFSKQGDTGPYQQYVAATFSASGGTYAVPLPGGTYDVHVVGSSVSHCFTLSTDRVIDFTMPPG